MIQSSSKIGFIFRADYSIRNRVIDEFHTIAFSDHTEKLYLADNTYVLSFELSTLEEYFDYTENDRPDILEVTHNTLFISEYGNISNIGISSSEDYLALLDGNNVLVLKVFIIFPLLHYC